MNQIFIAAIMAFILAATGVAQAQITAPSNDGAAMPVTHVDSGINAKGSASQQSPAADTKGTPVKLPAPAHQSNASGTQNNPLTNSPKGPGTGGNDAAK